MTPDERVFRDHLVGGPFRSGEVRGKWRLIAISWPHTVIGVRATARTDGPDEYALRFDLTNYPVDAPTAEPWDAEHDVRLPASAWPGGCSRVSQAFRPDWMQGQCLYIPCDRRSIAGHDIWATQHPNLSWKPTSDITLYLEAVYELLNSSDYTGPRGT